MNIKAINTPPCKYDGGATFGVVPKSIWKNLMFSDENNMVSSAMRCLLIIDNNEKILIDTGIGTKLNDKQKLHFSYTDTNSLSSLLKEQNISPEEITDVILTHLHFDHVGGATIYNSTGEAVPLFINARHWISEQQWENALNPNKREKASYHPENYLPLLENKLINLIDKDTWITKNIELRLFSGHTKGQIIPFIHSQAGVLVFMGDLIPTVHHLPIPYIASFDVDALKAMEEKEIFLKEALENEYTLFLEHDPENECVVLKDTPKGIRAKEIHLLNTFLSRIPSSKL